MHNRNKIRLNADLSLKTMAIRRQCKGKFKVPKTKGKGIVACLVHNKNIKD